MNLSDPMTLVGIAALIGAAAYAVWPSRQAIKAEPIREVGASFATKSSVNRGRQLIEFAEEIGLDNAGRKIETILGNAKADRVINDFRVAFSPEPPAPPTVPKS